MKILKALILAFILLTSTASGQSLEELKAHVEYLASDDLMGRQSGSEGMQEAIEYVLEECKSLNLPTYQQEVSVRGGTCHNVIAVMEGVNTDARIVVGAHLDHIGYKKWRDKTIIYNGADDNASGSAVVLGLAKRLAADPKPGCTIEFHWYTGEEQGLLGSATYTKKPLVEISHYKFMLDMDMVGRLRRMGWVGDNKYNLKVTDPFPYTEILDTMYQRYGFAKSITWAENTEDSDHASWWKSGVPAVILHTGLHDDYHQGGDEADRINYEGMVEVCDYAYDLITDILNEFSPGYSIYGD